jgi:hypothetical protein
MTTLRRILTTTTLAALACGIASANGIETFSCGNTGTQTTELGNPDGTLACPGADLSALAGGPYHLTSAVLTINGSIVYSAPSFESILQITNNGASTQTGSVAGYSTFYVDQTSGPPNSKTVLANFAGINTSFTPATVVPPANPIGMFTALSPVTAVTLAPGAEFTLTLSGSGTQSGTDSNGTDLLNWSALTGFSFIVDTATNEDNNFTGGNVVFNQTTYVDANASIVYSYAPTSTTPEPTTMALLGGALLGVGLIGKRLRKS